MTRITGCDKDAELRSQTGKIYGAVSASRALNKQRKQIK